MNRGATHSFAIQEIYRTNIVIGINHYPMIGKSALTALGMPELQQ